MCRHVVFCSVFLLLFLFTTGLVSNCEGHFSLAKVILNELFGGNACTVYLLIFAIHFELDLSFSASLCLYFIFV